MQFKNNELKKVTIRLEKKQIDLIENDSIEKKIGMNKIVRDIIDEYFRKKNE